MRLFHKRYAFIIDIISKFKKPDNKVIVDCACGTGDGTRMFLKYSRLLFGVDIDLKNVKIGRNSVCGVNFIVSSICSLPLKSHFADIFVCSETLEHLKPASCHRAALEIDRVLKPSGLLCITVPENKKDCLSKKEHKTYISFSDISGLFRDYVVLHKSIFIKNDKRKNGNLIVLLEKM